MKKYLLLILIFISIIFTSCQTTKINSVSTNQQKVAEIRKSYLLNSINSFDSNVFNNKDIKNIIGLDINNLRLVENEVPSLKMNLNTFDANLHTAYRLASIEYQKILLKYSKELNMPILYPYNNNYYISEENELTILFDTFGVEIDSELNKVLDSIFNECIIEYRILATNYNIYCDSLTALDRKTLTPIDIDITSKITPIFIKMVNSSIINIEETYQFEKTSINPDNITITN
ncbi:MAG: hypothetical protein JJE21_08115 [Spirochaetaceae bacterium]|nr:hypothetical protein [Spirochaetaceae bacterium]